MEPNHESERTRNQPTNQLPVNIKMAAPMQTHIRVLIAWKSVKQKAFFNVIWSKFEGTRNSYGFELMIAEIGVKTLR